LKVSYKNYEIDRENKRYHQIDYMKELQSQIKEKELKKSEELTKKRIQDRIDEDKMSKEIELLRLRAIEEDKRRNEEIEKYRLDNQRIMNSYMVMSKPKVLREITLNNVNYDEIERERLLQRRREIEMYNMNIKNNMEKIKNSIISQHNDLIKEINKLRERNAQSKLFKIDFKASINDMRKELKRKNFEDEIQKNLLYSSIVQSNVRKQELNNFYVNKSHNIL
jgi:hypothetical protein